MRLNGLRLNPDAFGSSFEEEVDRPVEGIAEALEAGFVVGAERAGVLVGLAGYRRDTHLKMRHRGGVWGMYVEPTARGLGVGERLLQAVIERARGEVEDLLLTVASHNEPAIALYRKLGFVEYGRDARALKVGEVYIDELLMTLALDPA